MPHTRTHPKGVKSIDNEEQVFGKLQEANHGLLVRPKKDGSAGIFIGWYPRKMERKTNLHV